MRVGEEDTTLGQPIDIGCSRLWMTAHAPNPVVQVINRDEQDVGRPVRRRAFSAAGRLEEKSDRENCGSANEFGSGHLKLAW